MKPKTHYQVRSDDPNQYITVRPSSEQVTDNFVMQELYNPNTGLEEHPISFDVVECVQIVRSFTGIPIRINSTYRNYIPKSGVNPATISPHMLGQGIDFSFITDRKTTESLYVAIRKDFDQKGPLFQHLWERGCRGFGSYDTFIHLDTVRPELYEPFRAKRQSTYHGQLYARWNNMKALRYQKADVVLQPEGGVEETNLQQNPIVEEVKKVGGTVAGLVKEVFDNEDQGEDFNVAHLSYLVAAAISVAIAASLGISFLK